MINLSIKASLIFSLFILCSCNQNSNRLPKNNFFEFLNNYQVDSLQILLADNFEITRTFTDKKTDRREFFEYYIPVSRNFNSQFKILKFEINEKHEKYLIEDQSDYLRLLKIDFPRWNITLDKNSSNQIEAAIFDTTETFQKYLDESSTKGKQFTGWLQLKYPEEEIDSLYTTNGLIQKRLIEYLNR